MNMVELAQDMLSRVDSLKKFNDLKSRLGRMESSTLRARLLAEIEAITEATIPGYDPGCVGKLITPRGEEFHVMYDRHLHMWYIPQSIEDQYDLKQAYEEQSVP